MTKKTNSQLSEIKVKYSNKTKVENRIMLTSSTDAEKFIRSIWSDQLEFREEFVMILLNRANHVIGWHTISSGRTAGTVVDPKIVFSVALKCMAHGIIFCHNHPSGNLKPSNADISLTKRLKQGCEILEITFLDHLIITFESYYSMSDEGII